MAVDAVLKVMDPSRPQMLDLRDIKVVTKVGGTIDDSELVDGMVFAQKAAKGAGGPQRVEKAQIGLIQVLPNQELFPPCRRLRGTGLKLIEHIFCTYSYRI